MVFTPKGGSLFRRPFPYVSFELTTYSLCRERRRWYMPKLSAYNRLHLSDEIFREGSELETGVCTDRCP